MTTNEVDEEVVIAEDDGKEVDAIFTETEEKAEEGKEEKVKQSKEKNREFADKRRAEKNAKEESELKFLKEYVGKNPYTNEPIETLRDVKVFKTMKQIDKNGGDPVGDYHKYAGLEEQKAIDSEKARTEQIEKEVKEFRESYPDINLNELSKEQDFVKFSNKLIGRVSLKDIYEAYSSLRSGLKESAEETAKTEIARKLAKDNTSAGNLSAVGDVGAPKYTLEQIGKMSQSEIDKNWKDVEASYNYWQKAK
ncbi:MAG: hypothetical protein IKA85_06780 [Clostridia bacterium]|nr:hypothetical protein [Clostridia bacterium]